MISKVLIVNKYHFISGGAERYFLSVMKALRERGIEPIPLSVDYEPTLPTPYQKYFIKPVAQKAPAKIQQMRPSLSQQMILAGRAIYSLEAKKSVLRIIRDHRPDLAYFLNFNNHISPSAIDACAEESVPVVMRMSDFNLVCAANMYYRDGHPCTDCKQGLFHAVRNRCVHGSYSRSLVQVFANSLHRWMGIYKKVRAFVAPTQLMKRDLEDQGFPAERIHQVNTFVRPCAEKMLPDTEHPYILFVGRMAPYKGVEAAVRAFAKLKGIDGLTLRLVGDDNDLYAQQVKRLAAQLEAKRIEFLPFERNPEKIHGLIHRALFTLVPSEFYENLPNTLLESFACGRPVIATRLGSLPDVIQEGRTGLLFDYGNIEDFTRKMRWLIDHDQEREQMGANASRAALEDYSEEGHVSKILAIFENVKEKNAPFLISRNSRAAASVTAG